jgi:chaperonin GroES
MTKAKLNVEPLYDRVVIKRLDAEEKSKGGLYIPEANKEKPQRGEVYAIGIGRMMEDASIKPLIVKIGDLVLFGKYAGAEIELDGEKYIIMREDDILGIVRG